MGSFYGNNGTSSGGGQDASSVKAQLDLHIADDNLHMTSAEKDKLEGIESGAQVNVDPDWADVQNKPTTLSGYGITDTYTKTEIDHIVKKENIIYIDSYSASNNNNASFTATPFIVHPKWYLDVIITSLKIKFVTTGTFSMGTIDRKYLSNNQTYNSNMINVYETFTIQQIGEQIIYLSSPLLVTKDKTLFFGEPTNTAVYKYGGAGVDTGLYYINGSNKITFTAPTSLGITVYGEKIETQQFTNPYKGKSLSILGDSISTFKDYVVSGNVYTYPASDVRYVYDTWWGKLINALEMNLEVNNSWSGTCVTTIIGEETAGCMARCLNLGQNPDVIIIWMGINDFDREVTLGTYNGVSGIPSNTSSFREAYGIMLNKIITKYPTSEIWCCTLPQAEKNGETGFPEINDSGVPLKAYNDAIIELASSFGVKVLDHNTSGIKYHNLSNNTYDSLHPNYMGHSLIANNDIKQLLSGSTLYSNYDKSKQEIDEIKESLSYDWWNDVVTTTGSTTASGITFTINSDKSVTISGTSSAENATRRILTNEVLQTYLLPGKKYRLKIDGLKTTYLRCYWYDDESQSVPPAINTTSTIDFIVPNNAYKVTLSFVVPFSGVTVNETAMINLFEMIDTAKEITEARGDYNSLNSKLNAILGTFASIENVTAIENHTIGDYIIVDGNLRKITSTITSGDTISNSNSSITTVGAEIQNLNTIINNKVTAEFDTQNHSLIFSTTT